MLYIQIQLNTINLISSFHIFHIIVVIRFTKEEILALRVETKVLEALGDIQEIVSIKSLPPSTDTPLDADDVNIFFQCVCLAL